MSGAWFISSLMVNGVWRELNVMVENLECEAVDLLHDLGSALHLLPLEAQEALKGCFQKCPNCPSL